MDGDADNLICYYVAVEVVGRCPYLAQLERGGGPADGKYSKKRLRIVIAAGRGYEGPIEGEYREDLESVRDKLNDHLTREANPKWT